MRLRHQYSEYDRREEKGRRTIDREREKRSTCLTRKISYLFRLPGKGQVQKTVFQKIGRMPIKIKKRIKRFVLRL